MNYDYEYDLTIIGAGPAGMTAAIYAARANLKTIMIDKKNPGGKVSTTATVENYPGFTMISGPDLSFHFFEQTQKQGVKFIMAEATSIEQIENNFKVVFLNNNKAIKTKAIIIATGMENRQIGAQNELEFFHKGISYCAICDGSLYKNKPVAVIGSGQSAVEEAIYLSDIASSVTVISNKVHFKADELAINKMLSINNIKTIMNSNTISFNGEEKLNSITIQNISNNEFTTINVDGAFIFIGFNPISPEIKNNSIFAPMSKFIEVDKNMKTNVSGIFAAGDIINKKIRQISTAVNDGTIAALSAFDYIKQNLWTK